MFKKLFALSLVLLTFCGCAQKNIVSPVLDNISFTAEIDYGDNELTADAKLTQGALNLIVAEPQVIKDLTLNITNNGVTVEFKGVTYTPDINSLPQGAIAEVLYDVINDIGVSQNTVVCVEENCKIKGSVNGYEYEFTFSPSGLPISLSIDELDLDIEFKNVTVG